MAKIKCRSIMGILIHRDELLGATILKIKKHEVRQRPALNKPLPTIEYH